MVLRDVDIILKNVFLLRAHFCLFFIKNKPQSLRHFYFFAELNRDEQMFEKMETKSSQKTLCKLKCYTELLHIHEIYAENWL